MTSRALFLKLAMAGPQMPASLAGQAPSPIVNPVQQKIIDERVSAEAGSAFDGAQNPDILQAQESAAQAEQAAAQSAQQAQEMAKQEIMAKDLEAQKLFQENQAAQREADRKTRDEKELLEHKLRLKEQELQHAKLEAQRPKADEAVAEGRMQLREEELAMRERLAEKSMVIREQESALRSMFAGGEGKQEKAANVDQPKFYESPTQKMWRPNWNIGKIPVGDILMDQVFMPWLAQGSRSRVHATPGSMASYMQQTTGQDPFSRSNVKAPTLVSMFSNYLQQA